MLHGPSKSPSGFDVLCCSNLCVNHQSPVTHLFPNPFLPRLPPPSSRCLPFTGTNLRLLRSPPLSIRLPSIFLHQPECRAGVEAAVEGVGGEDVGVVEGTPVQRVCSCPGRHKNWAWTIALMALPCKKSPTHRSSPILYGTPRVDKPPGGSSTRHHHPP